MSTIRLFVVEDQPEFTKNQLKCWKQHRNSNCWDGALG